MSRSQAQFAVSKLRGIDERWDVAPHSATYIQNMTWTNQDSWHTSKGYDRITYDYPVEGTPTNYWNTVQEPLSLYWFSQHGNALQYLIYEDKAGSLRYINGSTSPTLPSRVVQFVDGSDVGSSSYLRSCAGQTISNTTYAMFGRHLYLFNGSDLPIVFDGKKASRVGYSQAPGIPTVTVAAKLQVREKVNGVPYGVGYENSRNQYKYVVTFVNERGQESPFSEPSEKLSYDVKDIGDWKQQIDAGGGTPVYAQLVAGQYKQQPIVTIPVGPAGTVARRIYRTQNMISFFSEGTTSAGVGSPVFTEQFREAEYGSEFYFVDEVQDNICTRYVDTLSDLDLGSKSDKKDLGPFPSGISLAAVYKNTMFVANGNTSDLRYSRPLHPEVFPILNNFPLSDTQTSLITGLYPMRDALIVFKSRGTYILIGDPQNGFFVETLSTDIGCIAPQTIRNVPGVGLMFLSLSGIYMLGTQSQSTGTPYGFVKLSTSIDETFKRINKAYAKSFRANLYHNDREYWISVALDGSQKPNHILKYSYEIGAWSLYKDVDCTGLAETQDHRGYMFIAVGTSTNPGFPQSKGIMVYGSSNDKSGYGTPESIYETSNISLAGLYDYFAPETILPRVIGYGHSIAIDIITNRSPTVVSATGDALTRRLVEDQDFPSYGNSSFDSSEYYQTHRPLPITIDISTMDNLNEGPINDMRIRFKNSTEFQILGFEMWADVGSKRNLKPLTEKFGGGFGL